MTENNHEKHATDEASELNRVAVQNTLTQLIQRQNELLQTQERLLFRNEASLNTLVEEVKSLRGEVTTILNRIPDRSDEIEIHTNAILAPTMDSVWNFLSQTQLGLKSTLERLVNTNESFARFGDGEFKLMLSAWRNLAFQQNSFDLIDELEATLTDQVDDLLIGLPQFMRNVNYLKLWPKIWGHLHTLLSSNQTYGNSHVSRPLAFKFLGSTAVELWREVWRDKSLTIITGHGSRFDTVPALFDSCSRIDRIDSTPMNAFSDRERIIDLAEKNDADIFIVSLGPAGTVLTHDLAARGRRALDVGHLSAAYLNILEGQAVPEHTPLSR